MEEKADGHSDELTPDEKVSEELERANHQFPIVGLGASAGGLKALTQFFECDLERLFGQRMQMDAGAITEYFKPLLGWLEEQNQGKTCSW